VLQGAKSEGEGTGEFLTSLRHQGAILVDRGAAGEETDGGTELKTAAAMVARGWGLGRRQRCPSAPRGHKGGWCGPLIGQADLEVACAGGIGRRWCYSTRFGGRG